MISWSERSPCIFQIHRMNYQLKQILEHDKLDLLDTEHIISENRWGEIRAQGSPRDDMIDFCIQISDGKT